MSTRLFGGLAVLAGLGLAGCGGSGAPETAAPAAVDAVPATATLDGRSFTQFVGSLKSADDREPLALDRVTPPTSDGDEPLPVSG